MIDKDRNAILAVIFILWLAFLTVFFVLLSHWVDSSGNPSSPANAVIAGRDSTNQPPQNTNKNGIVNYGNDVYYFPMTKAAFGNALASFLDSHGSLEVSAMACDIVRMEDNSPASPGPNRCDWGGIGGYFVTFRDKK